MAIAAIAGGAISALASIFGSNEQAKQLKRARETLGKQYSKAQEQISPWRDAGAQALDMLTQMTLEGPGELTEDAGYQFEVAEGLKAGRRGGGAKGVLGTGAFAKRMTEWGQGLASTRYNDFFNRYRARLSDLGALSGTGLSAASESAGLYEREGQGLADLQTTTGQARASGYTGIANSIRGGLRDYQTSQYLDNMQGGGGGGGGFTQGGAKLLSMFGRS